jgi:SAM-dependent methyltransferase
MHGTEDVSPWVARWAHLVPTGGSVLDVACGYGRHSQWFFKRNYAVVSVDRSSDAIESLAVWCATNPPDAPHAKAPELVLADIENAPWPFAGRQFDGIVVTNYLWRALLPTIVQSLAPGGVLIYETFAVGNETVGKPSRPDFLLQTGELLRACAPLSVVAYEDGFLDTPERFVQRIVAVRSGGNSSHAPARYSLRPAGLTHWSVK